MEPTEGNIRPAAKVELIDNWSDRWKPAVELLHELGDVTVLRLDEEGWLPARQNFLVAFTPGGRPVAHLCFHVQPLVKDGALVTDPAGRPITEAVVDGEGHLTDYRATVRQLREAAMHRALELRCARFRWETAEAGVA